MSEEVNAKSKNWQGNKEQEFWLSSIFFPLNLQHCANVCLVQTVCIFEKKKQKRKP